MNYYEILTLITLLFLVVALVCLGRYRRKWQHLIRENSDLSQKNVQLSAHCSELKDKYEENQEFKNNLVDAEIITKLQTTRTSYQGGEVSAPVPERYNYINALSESGMEPEKIAELMSISINEARQLVSLSKLSNELRCS